FAVESQPAGGRVDAHLAAVPGDLYVAFGVRDFDVALARVYRDVAHGITNLNVTSAANDSHRRGHVGDGDVALFIANGEHRFFRYRDFKIQAQPRIAAAGRMNFVTVAILNNFDRSSVRELLGVSL